MKKNNQRFVLTALACAMYLLPSCEKEIEYKGEAGTSLLVINQLIEKDSTFSIQIKRSVFFLENNSTNTSLSDATVTLKNLTNGSTETVVSGNNGLYDFAMTATEGHSYEVVASHADYPTASAQTIIPQSIPIISVDTSTYIDPEFQETMMKVKLRWSDPSEKNYYILTVSADYLGGFGEDRISMDTYDLSVVNGGDIDGLSSGSMLALDDNFFNGSLKELQVEFPVPSASSVDGIILRLYHCTENTSRYLISAETDLLSGGGGTFSEPVKIHSNVKDGYGIFSGFAQGAYTIQY